MPRLTSPFVLDLRSIALFRVLLGAAMLYDVLCRLPYATLFLSDQGAFTRADHLELVQRPWSLSVYMALGHPLQVKFALLAHAVAALALIVGYRTRLAIILCWVMLVSLQHRNPLVLNGGDTLLCVLAFWAMFLPLNARYSLDRMRSSEGEALEGADSNRFGGVPAFALVAQVTLVYAFTWILKSGELWRNGEAVGYVLSNLSLTTSGGAWLRHYTSAHPILTQMTFHWEWFGLALALCPWRNGLMRQIAIAGFVTMHLCFAATLDLALFPLVSTMGWLALLPASFWDRVGHWSKRFSGIGGALRNRLSGIRAGRIIRPGQWSSFFAAIAIGLVFVWNVAGVPGSPLRGQMPQPIKDTLSLFKLRQRWSMFAANPPRHSTWYAIEAQLANGDSYDLLYPEQLYSLRSPDVFTDRLPDRRWGKFLSQIGKRRYRQLRQPFIEFFVERWNESAPPEQRIETAKLIGIREPIFTGRMATDQDIRTLATYRVENVSQIKETDPSASENSDTSELDAALDEENEAL